MDIEKQRRRKEIKESKFAKEIQRIILSEELPGYLGGTTHRNKKELQTMARFRLGSENKSARYWSKEEERRCRLCKSEEETLEHIVKKCRYTKEEGIRWEEILKGGRTNLARLHTILWKRKREDRNS